MSEDKCFCGTVHGAEVVVFFDPKAGIHCDGRWIVQWGKTRLMNFSGEGDAHRYARTVRTATPGNPGVRVVGA